MNATLSGPPKPAGAPLWRPRFRTGTPPSGASPSGKNDCSFRAGVSVAMNDSSGADVVPAAVERGGVFHRALPVVLGGVLLLSAGFKTVALVQDRLPSNSLLTSPLAVLGAVAVEIAIGLWLCSGLAPRAARQAGVAVFLVLAGASAYSIWAGRPSCGCLGDLTISPWATLLFDQLAVGGLLLWRPTRTSAPLSGRGYPLAVAVTSLGLVGLFLAVLTLLYGSPAAGLAALSGTGVSVDPPL